MQTAPQKCGRRPESTRTSCITSAERAASTLTAMMTPAERPASTRAAPQVSSGATESTRTPTGVAQRRLHGLRTRFRTKSRELRRAPSAQSLPLQPLPESLVPDRFCCLYRFRTGVVPVRRCGRWSRGEVCKWVHRMVIRDGSGSSPALDRILWEYLATERELRRAPAGDRPALLEKLRRIRTSKAWKRAVVVVERELRKRYPRVPRRERWTREAIDEPEGGPPAPAGSGSRHGPR